MLGGEWQPVNDGESGCEVYRRADVFAKCCGPSGIRELAGERDRVEWLAGTGAPSVRVLDWSESEDGACLMTSAAKGVAGVDLPSASYQQAMTGLGRALRELHSVSDCPFERPLPVVLAQASDVVRRGAVNPDFLTDEWRLVPPPELLARLWTEYPYALDHAAADQAVCHGDACLPNVFFDPDTLAVTAFIDLGRLGRADPHADLALTTIQLADEWVVDPAPFLAAYGREPDQRLLEFYRLLDPLTWG